MLSCTAGVSAMFHTYISPEVYELFVKEVSARLGADINRFRTGYDCVSFLAFGLWYFEGVKWGTTVLREMCSAPAICRWLIPPSRILRMSL